MSYRNVNDFAIVKENQLLQQEIDLLFKISYEL